MILGISGLVLTEDGRPLGSAGAGKDTFADFLSQDFGHGKVALADPLKRIARDVYDFTEEQLWGPSHMRNAPDERYPREHTFGEPGDTCPCCGAVEGKDDERQCYLTPRYALQLLGSEWGRHCFLNTWVAVAMRTSHKLISTRGLSYSAKVGLSHSDESLDGVSIPDVRFLNEIQGIRERGGKLIRVKRVQKGVDPGSIRLHVSERESVSIPDSAFDLVIDNDSTLEDLRKAAHDAVATIRKG